MLLGALLIGDKIFRITMTIVSLLGLKELIDIKYKNKKILPIKIISYILLIILMLNKIIYKLDTSNILILILL